MAAAFGNAMAKLAVLGQDTSHMIDCSEVIPVPKSLPVENSQSVYPAGFSNADVEQAVCILWSVSISLLTTSLVVCRTFPATFDASRPSHFCATCVSATLNLAIIALMNIALKNKFSYFGLMGFWGV